MSPNGAGLSSTVSLAVMRRSGGKVSTLLVLYGSGTGRHGSGRAGRAIKVDRLQRDDDPRCGHPLLPLHFTASGTLAGRRFCPIRVNPFLLASQASGMNPVVSGEKGNIACHAEVCFCDGRTLVWGMEWPTTPQPLLHPAYRPLGTSCAARCHFDWANGPMPGRAPTNTWQSTLTVASRTPWGSPSEP